MQPRPTRPPPPLASCWLCLWAALTLSLGACEEEALVAGASGPWGDAAGPGDASAGLDMASTADVPSGPDVHGALDTAATGDGGAPDLPPDGFAPADVIQDGAVGDGAGPDGAGPDGAGPDTGSDATGDGGAPDLPPGDASADSAVDCEVGATELCNGLDDDCDGQTDEGLCEDGNSCTLDICQAGVCAHLPADGPCDDEDLCTLDDACHEGACGGKAVVCDDADVCTWDVCHPATGACHWLPIPGICGACLSAADCPLPTPCTLGLACIAGKCTDTGQVQVDTLVGGAPGAADGVAPNASLQGPAGVAYALDGDLLIADRDNHLIRELDVSGTLKTLAGKGVAGYADGMGAAAAFHHPSDLVGGPGAQVWIVDTDNHRLRHLAATGKVSTLAGMDAGFADGKGLAARFNRPHGIARTAGGALIVADTDNHRIRVVAPDGTVSTLAGSQQGHANGPGQVARFSSPWAVAVDGLGRVLVADRDNHRVRRITPAGLVTDLAGTTQGALDGPVGAAQFSLPTGVAVDLAGRVFVAEAGNHRLRGILDATKVWTLAGSGIKGALDGPALQARFDGPQGISAGPQGWVAIADTVNHRVRRVRDGTGACQVGKTCYAKGMFSLGAPCLVCDGTNPTSLAVVADGVPCDDGQLCTADGVCSAGACTPGIATGCDDKNPCTQDACDTTTGACLNQPIVGCDGYCESDAHCQDTNPCLLGETCVNHKCDTSGTLQVQTAAGSVAGMADGPALQAALHAPHGLGYSLTGVLYIADRDNHRVRRLTPDGKLYTVAGKGTAGYADGAAATALFYGPTDVASGPDGTLWVADSQNNRLRQIGSNGNVSTLVGLDPGFVDGSADKARFNRPVGLALNATGVAVVADYFNNRIRRVMPDGSVSTLAGSVAGHANGYGAQARFDRPVGLDIDGQGRVYVADRDNHRIRRITPEGLVTDLAGSVAGFLDGPGDKARFSHPNDVVVARDGRVWVADAFNNRVRVLDLDGSVQTAAGTGVPDLLDGPGDKARFQLPSGLAIDPWGWLHVADLANHRIRAVRQTKGACYIAGVCWASGQPKSPGACDLCGPAGPLAWSTAPNGTACGDGGPCALPGSCLGGACAVTGPKDCDDKDACTADACDPLTGACTHLPIQGCP